MVSKLNHLGEHLVHRCLFDVYSLEEVVLLLVDWTHIEATVDRVMIDAAGQSYHDLAEGVHLGCQLTLVSWLSGSSYHILDLLNFAFTNLTAWVFIQRKGQRYGRFEFLGEELSRATEF